MNGCHLLVAILDCGAEMLSLFRTRQGQIGWGLLVFTCVIRRRRDIYLYIQLNKASITSPKPSLGPFSTDIRRVLARSSQASTYIEGEPFCASKSLYLSCDCSESCTCRSWSLCLFTSASLAFDLALSRFNFVLLSSGPCDIVPFSVFAVIHQVPGSLRDA